MSVQIAKRYIFDTTEDLRPTTGGVEMPFKHVTMPPGVYVAGEESWDCTRPGLYRFKVTSESFFRNRIVYDRSDLYGLVSAVCWNLVQGTAHETTGDIQAVSDVGRYVVWRMRCGYIGNYMAWLLPQFGFQVRQVGVICSAERRNGIDDGHQVVEVFHNDRWVMFDMTNGCYWEDASGAHMGTQAFIDHIADGKPFPTKRLLDGNQRRWDHESIPLAEGAQLDMGLYGELCVTGIETSEGWMRRIFHMIDVPSGA